MSQYVPPHGPPPYGGGPPPQSPYGAPVPPYGMPPPPAPYYPGPGGFHAGPPRGSGVGVAACVVGAIAILCSLFAAAVMIAGSGRAGHGPPTTDDFVLGFGMLAGCGGGGLLGVVAVVLGIVGVSLPNRRKGAAVAGMVLGATALGLIALAMAVA